MSYTGLSKEELKNMIVDNLKNMYRKTIDEASRQEIYHAAVFAVRDVVTDKWIRTHNTYKEKDVKVVYYLSMEFLMGRFFGKQHIEFIHV